MERSRRFRSRNALMLTLALILVACSTGEQSTVQPQATLPVATIVDVSPVETAAVEQTVPAETAIAEETATAATAGTQTADEALLESILGAPTAEPTLAPTPSMPDPVLIERVTTDRSMYAPGTPVQITVELRNHMSTAYTGRLILTFYHLGASVADEQTQQVTGLARDASAAHTFTWTPPPTDFTGYRIEVRALDQNGTTALETAATAVDVSSDWAKFPRYGFVSRFDDAIDAATVMSKLNEYHINGIQFYDWQWQHHRPYSPEETWPDIANRRISRNVVSALIDEAHRRNMIAMNYSLAFGAYDNYWQDGSGAEVAWGLFKDGNGNYTPERQDFHPLPGGWATSKLYLMNPGNAGWQQYIFAREQEAFDHFAFDGWHIDTLGRRDALWDWDGQPVDLAATFAPFTNNAKAALQKRVLFNAVGGYGQDQITAGADVDFLYTELWENDGIRSYNDIVQQVVKARTRSDKALVFPAYMNRGLSQVSQPGTTFNEASVRLANAVIFAAGAAHLELGDDEGMLSTEYFPSQTLVMGVGLKRAMHDYYDFLVAYENLLRDGITDSPNKVTLDGISTSTDGARGTVWTLVKNRPGTTIVHLINLTNTPSSDWRDSIGNYPIPETLVDVPVKVYSSDALPEGARLWYASPDRDHGKAQELTYTTGSDEQGTFVTTTVPQLHYWDILWLDMGTNE